MIILFGSLVTLLGLYTYSLTVNMSYQELTQLFYV